MKARLVSFGHLEVDGRSFHHDVVIEHGRVRKRKKAPSKAHRDLYGHTPLSVDELIPWSTGQLIVGTGATGALPIMPDVLDEAERRRVTILARPTGEACELLSDLPDDRVAAILHVTC